MAKTLTATTRAPLSLAVGRGVYAEDLQEIAAQLNWTHDHIGVTHVAVTTDIAGWGSSGNEVMTHGTVFDTTSGLVEQYRFRIKVDPDVTTITFGAECYFTAGDGGDVKLAVGASSATLSFTSSDNGTEKSTTLATSATGTGKLTCVVELNHTTGSTADQRLCNFRVESKEQVGSPPDPVLE